MELNKISSFKSFSEMRNQETAIKTEQENKVKRVKSLEKISAILDELQITDMSELDEEKKKALYAKLFNEDRQEEIEDDIVKLGKETDLTKKVGAIAGKSVADEVDEDRAQDIEDKIVKLGATKKEDIKDGKELEAELDEAKVTLDAIEPTEKGLVDFCKKHGIKWKIVNMHGPAANYPEVEYIGKEKDLRTMIQGFWGEDSGLEEFIEEGVLTLEFDPIHGEYIFEARSETKVFKLLQKIFAGAPLLTKDKAQHIAIVDGLYMDAMEDANFYNEAKDASFAAFQSFFNAYGKAIEVDVPGLSGTKMTIGKKEIEAWQGKWTSDISSAGQWNGYDITLGFRKYLESIGEPKVGVELDIAFGKANESVTVKVDEARSINKIQNEFTKIINQMKNTAELWKQAQGDEKATLLNTLKDLTAQKKKLEAELDDAITDKDKDLELVVTEGNAFTGALFAARNKGEKTFEFNGKTYKVAGAKKVNEDDEEVKEGNAFGDAVRKAKEAGEKEFEFDGKKYKVEESKHNPSVKIVKEQINEAKQFDKDYADMETSIKRGIGWIDPEYVETTWENSSDTIDFELVKAELYKRLLKAGLLWYGDEEKETQVKSLKELGIKESVVNEAAKFKNTKNFEDFLEEIDGMGEAGIKKIMGKDYIDTPGNYNEEAEDYDNDIVEYMISNMGKKEFERLQDWWEANVAESVVNEAEVKSDDEFKEYAMNVLKKAFGADFDEAKAGEVVDGILKKCDGDYGAAVGMLTSSLGESVTNEAVKTNSPNEVITIELDMAWDDSDKEDDKAAKAAFKKYKIKVEEIKGQDGTFEVTGKKKDILAYLQSEFYEMDDETVEEFYPELLETIDVSYWEDYNKDTSGQADPSYATKVKVFDLAFEEAVETWNDEAEGEENQIDDDQARKIEKLAYEFFKRKRWISINIIHAMIAQES